MSRTEYLSPIFDHQVALMGKFHPIERQNRPELPNRSILSSTDLETVWGQLRIKEYAWRITEEVGEALKDYSDTNKYREEVADALHFLVEMFIILGFHPVDFDQSETSDGLSTLYSKVHELQDYSSISPPEYWAFFIMELSSAMNLLKNRPWKVKFTKTNYVEFYRQMFQVFYAFVRAAMMSGINRDILFESYMSKAKKNAERIEQGV